LGKIIKIADTMANYFDPVACDYELAEFSHQPPNGYSSVQTIVQEKTEAEKILERAQTQAEMMINTARLEIHGIYEKAENEGYQAGMAQAATEARQHSQQIAEQLQQLVQRLESGISQAQQDRLDLIDSVEPAVLKLITDSVEKIVRHEIKTDPRIVLRNIKACLRRIKDVNEVTIRVSPAELTFVKSQREELISCSECIHSAAIVDDRRVGSGGCIVESTSGDFDATVDTQLERITNRIMEIAADASNTEVGS